jgi:hypothetical protein
MSNEAQDRIGDLKRRINEIAFAPLSEHGALFEGVNRELNDELAVVEGLSANGASQNKTTRES